MEEQAGSAFFFSPPFFFSWPCNTVGLCFVSCHSQKNTDVKENVLWLMAGSEEAEVEKSCWVHLALTIALPSLTRSALSSLPLLPELSPRVSLPQNCAEHSAVWARAACGALLPGLRQGTMRFSFGCCELRLGPLKSKTCLVSLEWPSCSCPPRCGRLSACSRLQPVCQRKRVTYLCGNIISSCGSQSFLHSRVRMGGQPERVGAPNTSVQHQSISHWVERWNVR